MHGIKSDKWILDQCRTNNLLYPFVDKSIKAVDGKRIISYGLSSYGYDLRCADEFQVFRQPLQSCFIDPKQCNDVCFSYRWSPQPFCIIPPNSFALTRSVEYIKMPRNVTGICMGKSTYARVGLIANITPLEAGWEGYLTIELSNTTPLPVKVYPNEGICQILFFESAEECMTSYADRGGKYQGQTGITNAKV